MPERTAAELRGDGFFIARDLCRLDVDGDLQIVGRDTALIISGGYNISLREIEVVLDAQPGVLEAAVIGVPHPDFGETPLGLVVQERGAIPGLAAIAAALRTALARYKHPRDPTLAPELPRKPMGKVQKDVLREHHRDCFVRA